MNRNEITTLFILAATSKEVYDFDKMDKAFLATVGHGIPNGVRVVYLFDPDYSRPQSLEDVMHADLICLEFDGQEQVMPFSMLVRKDAQLGASLFAAAEFRPRQDLTFPDDYDLD